MPAKQRLAEFPTRIQDKFQLREQRVRVEFHAPVERDQVSVEIVEHLDLGGRLREKNGDAACEGLDVARVLGNQWKDVLEELRFPPGQEAAGLMR